MAFHAIFLSFIILILPFGLSNKVALNHDAEALKLYLANDSISVDARDNLLPNIQPHDFTIDLNITKKAAVYVKSFYLWTQAYRDGAEYELLDAKNISSIKYSHFATRKTFIVLHGFLGYGLEDWIISLKDKFLRMEDCNVISVDWPAGTHWFLPTYLTAVKHVAYVGNETAVLLASLVQYKGLLLEDVHFIGHSLGAHVAGFASKDFKGRIGRITGLDPAGPKFHKLPVSQRLDKTDAIYVDVIHTNSCKKRIYWVDCFGLNENIGHSDFWPNGGEHQPGCIGKLIRGDIGCDHMIAHKYFFESLNYSNTDSFFLARPCSSWAKFASHNCSCGTMPQFMGINVNTLVTGVYFLSTNATAPYAERDLGCEAASVPTHMILLIVGAILSIVLIISFLVCDCGRCFHRRSNSSSETQHLLPNGQRYGAVRA